MSDRKQYYLDNYNKINKYGRVYYKFYKDRIKTNADIIINCSCGLEVRKGALYHHRRSKRHNNLLKNKE